MSAKVVRTTVCYPFTCDLDEMGFEHQKQVAILPAADYDRMVEREKAARELLENAANELRHAGLCQECADGPPCHLSDAEFVQSTIHAFLNETKGTSDGK